MTDILRTKMTQLALCWVKRFFKLLLTTVLFLKDSLQEAYHFLDQFFALSIFVIYHRIHFYHYFLSLLFLLYCIAFERVKKHLRVPSGYRLSKILLTAETKNIKGTDICCLRIHVWTSTLQRDYNKRCYFRKLNKYFSKKEKTTFYFLVFVLFFAPFFAHSSQAALLAQLLIFNTVRYFNYLCFFVR